MKLTKIIKTPPTIAAARNNLENRPELTTSGL